MSEERRPGPRREDGDAPVIWLHVRLTKRIGVLSPMAVRIWEGLKATLFLAALATTLWILVDERIEAADALRWGLAAVLVWMVWDRGLARNRYGLSHILVTDKGVVFTEENLVLEWEEIESWRLGGGLLRLTPRPGFGPRRLFGRGELDIPVTDRNRELLLDLFREHVEVWRP